MSATTHPGIRYPASVMLEAQRLHRDSDGTLSLAEIRRQLTKTHGVQPSTDTIHRWIDPQYADRAREQNVASDRRWRARTGQFQFKLIQGGTSLKATPEYRQAFIRRLRAEGVPRTSIAKVCRVVFDDPSIGRDDVHRALNDISPSGAREQGRRRDVA